MPALFMAAHICFRTSGVMRVDFSVSTLHTERRRPSRETPILPHPH